MPWSIFNRPSIQLGALKSYVERETTYKVDTYHPYLHLAKAITTKLYGRIGLSGWAGEALFAPLLFPEKELMPGNYFVNALKAITKKQIPCRILTNWIHGRGELPTMAGKNSLSTNIT